MTNIESFRNIHAGETLLLVGNGENLRLTPPEAFDCPSIGMNTIHLYEGWRPSYYVAVDQRIWREFGEAINARFGDIPKFIPKPKLTRWRGPNFYRFRNKPGPLYSRRNGKIWQGDIAKAEVTYTNVMQVAIKLAFFMGAKTILIVGMEHKPHNARAHFWGEDQGLASPDAALTEIFEGYRQLWAELDKRGVQLLNISQDTYVPGDVIPTDTWEHWANNRPEEDPEEE